MDWSLGEINIWLFPLFFLGRMKHFQWLRNGSDWYDGFKKADFMLGRSSLGVPAESLVWSWESCVWKMRRGKSCQEESPCVKGKFVEQDCFARPVWTLVPAQKPTMTMWYFHSLAESLAGHLAFAKDSLRLQNGWNKGFSAAVNLFFQGILPTALVTENLKDWRANDSDASVVSTRERN